MQAAILFLAPMEMLKLYMLAAFAFKALNLPLPLLAPSLAFLAALTLGLIMRMVGGRRIWLPLAQLLGLGLTLLALYRTGLGARWDGSANRYFFSEAILGGTFWLRGAWLAKKDHTHAFCLARFEEGVAVYLAVFFISISIGTDSTNALGSSLAFFLCGILALGTSKARPTAAGGFAGSKRGTPLFLVAVGFLAAAASLFSVARELQRSAEQARIALKTGALEFIRIFGALLDRLFTIRRSTATAGQDSGDTLYRMAEREAPADSLFARILFAAFAVILAAVVLTILVVLLVWILRALRALASERTVPADLSFMPAWLRAFVRGCARFILRLSQLHARRKKRGTAARTAYARLLACGRAAAAPRRHTETAREYASRLSRLAPRAATQAHFIVQSLEQEVYGTTVTNAATTARLVAARASLHPYWFAVERFRRPRQTTRRSI